MVRPAVILQIFRDPGEKVSGVGKIADKIESSG